jgi:hypothetical protein
MYLNDFFAVNSGPISQLHIPFQATSDSPLPTVLLGTNGRGKTSILSIITDSLYELSAQHYTDILPMNGAGRSWFRVVGSKTVKAGTEGGYSVLRFHDDGAEVFYTEKGGTFSPDQARNNLPTELQAGVNWAPNDNAHKQVSLAAERAEKIFRDGAYVYFPSSRSERPYWLNTEALGADKFSDELRLSNRLGKPIFIENGLREFAQWLMSVLIETRRDQQIGHIENFGPIPVALQPSHPSLDGMPLWTAANHILKGILRNDAARFGWFGRNSAQKIGVSFGNGSSVAGLDCLSAGQASLLLVFGTLLRYADLSGSFTSLWEISGICIADEIDSHLHIDLQTKVLPELIAMFPKVQFILSSHSPLLAYAMEKKFGADGVRLFDLDTGAYISATAFSEFENAFAVMADTERFENDVLAKAQAAGKPLVLVEGETDPRYIKRAAQALGKEDLLDRVDFEWVGTKIGGNATNTGTKALNVAFNMLRSNQALTNRPVLLLHDCDANKPAEDVGNVHVRSIPKNETSTKAKRGIENLLPDSCFTDDVYDTIKKVDEYGAESMISTLAKVRLCDKICAPETSADTFAKFSAVFEIVEQVFPSPCPAGLPAGLR